MIQDNLVDMGKPLFKGEKTYYYRLVHPRFDDSCCYIKGNTSSEVLSLLIPYLQFFMKEVNSNVTLFSSEYTRILCKLYGFSHSSQQEFVEENGVEIDITEGFSKDQDLDYAYLLLPFYRKGLISELQLIVQEILDHHNAITED